MKRKFKNRGQKVKEFEIPPSSCRTNENVNSIIRAVCENNSSFFKELESKLDSGKNFVIVGPMGSNKSTAMLASALYNLYTGRGFNALIAYTRREIAELQFEFFQRLSREKRIDWLFDIFKNIYEYDKRKRPSIFITDIFSLHKNYLVPSPYRDRFWQDISFIGFEDINFYSGIFGMNVSLLIKRILFLLEYLKNKKYVVALSSSLINNLDEIVTRLVGEKFKAQFDIINACSQDSAKKKFVIWEPPLVKVDYVSERGGENEETRTRIHLMRGSLLDELKNLLRKLFEEEQGSVIGVVWEHTDLDLSQRSAIYKAFDDIGMELSKKLILSDTLDDLFLKTSKLGVRIDKLILVEPITPLNYFIKNTEFVKSILEIYIILPLDVTYRSVTRSRFFQRGDVKYELEIPLPDNEVIMKHFEYLQDDIPNIDKNHLELLGWNKFVEDGRKRMDLNEEYFLFFPLSMEYNKFPIGERKDEDMLIVPHSEDFFKIQFGDNVLEKIPPNLAYTDYFPRSIIQKFGQKFFVNSMDLENRDIRLYPISSDFPSRVFKILDNIDKTHDSELVKRHRFKNLIIELRRGDLTERVVGIRSLKGTDERELVEERYDTPYSFLYKNIPYLVINFASKENQNVGSGVLHVITHLLKAYLRNKFVLKLNDIGFFFNDREIVIYDRTGYHERALSFLTYPGSISTFFEFAYEILKDCPCVEGSYNCSKTLYCEAPEYNDPIDKLPAIEFISELLNRREEFEQIRFLKEHGVNQESKLQEIVKRCREIMELKCGIYFKEGEVYNVRFMDASELNAHREALGVTIRDENGGYIIINPGGRSNDGDYLGIPEPMMYFTVAHELTHNWQHHNLASDLINIRWDNRDHPYNPPFGNLIFEGHANWSASKVMDYFGLRDISEDSLSGTLLIEYRVGLKILLYLEEKYGIERLNEFLKRGFSELDEEDQSFDSLLKNSGAVSDINQEYTRMVNEGGLKCYINDASKQKPTVMSFGISLRAPIQVDGEIDGERANIAGMSIEELLERGGNWIEPILLENVFNNIGRIPCVECQNAANCPLYKACFINNVDFEGVVDNILNDQNLREELLQ